MRKYSVSIEIITENEFSRGSRNWLLHARYVRGEHSLCLDLADQLQNETENTHRYAHFIKGLVLADAGRLQEALERFHSCIRLHPQDPEPLKQVAKCLYRQGRFQLSLEAYLEAEKISKYPDADIYCFLDYYGGASPCVLPYVFISGLNLHACGADTVAACGALRLRAGDPRRAFQLLGAALAQQPTQHAAALALAAMMLNHKDVDAALARLKAALSAHSTCVAAHVNLGLALLAKKKFIAALTCLQRAVWAAPLSSRASYDLGLALLVCKRPASAFCRLAAAAALEPSQPTTVLLIAISLERLGDSRADAAFTRAVSLAPDDPLIRLNLAAKHARAGRLKDAAEEAEITVKLLQDSGDAQLTNALATLLALLREHGVEMAALTTSLPDVVDQPLAKDENVMDEEMATDEV